MVRYSLVIFLLCFVYNAQSQDSNYCSISPSHTLCQYTGIGRSCGSGGVISNGIGEAEKSQILDLHNQLRSNVAIGLELRGRPGPQKSASNMMQLTWDPELARIAQRWADQCQFGHDIERGVSRFTVGQNVHEQSAFNDDPVDFKRAIDGWYNEVSAFDNSDADDYAFNPGTGHYTQIVWGETSKIGCGASIYRRGQFFKKFVVCNYGKGGNLLRASMYKTGNPCSECPGNTVCSQQYPGLCQSNGAAGQLPVIVPQISPNVPPTNALDQMRPSTPIGSEGAFRPMFVEIPDSNSNFGLTQSQLQPNIIPSRPNNVIVFSPRPSSRPVIFRPRPNQQQRPSGFRRPRTNPFASFFGLFQG